MSLEIVKEMHHIKEAVQNAFSEAMSKSGMDGELMQKVMKNLPMKQVMAVSKTALETAAAALKKKDIRKNKDAPRAPLSAYNFFGHDLREGLITVKDFNSKHAEAKSMLALLKKINAPDKSYRLALSDVATLWPGVSNEARERFAQRAVADKERFDKEMESYVPTPEMPKAPHKSAVDMYIKEKQAEDKEISRKDLLKQWEELSTEVQSKYITRVAQEKLEYRELNSLMKESLTPEQLQKLEREADPNVPSKPKSAYLFFSIAYRPTMVEEMEKKGEEVNMPNVAAKIGAVWTTYTDAQKQPYIKMAEDDKERYRQEMELHAKGEYVSPKVEKAKEKLLVQKAGSMYVKSLKAAWKSEGKYSDKNGKDIHTLASEMWKELTESDRAEWVEKAKDSNVEESASSSSSSSSPSESTEMKKRKSEEVEEKSSSSASSASKNEAAKKKKVVKASS